MGAPSAAEVAGTAAVGAHPSLTLRRLSRRSTPHRTSSSASSASYASALSKSKWDEGVSVVQSLLQPGSATYQAMTPEQRHGLNQVEILLLEGVSIGHGRNAVHTMSHIPTELIRMESEASTSHQNNSNYRYLMKEFGGVQESRAIRKVRTALLANTWAQNVFHRAEPGHAHAHAHGHELSTTSTSTNMSTPTSTSTDSNSNAKNEDDVNTTKLYLPSEFQSLEKDVQIRIYQEFLNWNSLQQWEFNVFELTKLSKGHPLVLIGWALLASPYAQTAMKDTCGLLVQQKQDHGHTLDSTTATTTTTTTTGGGMGYNFCETYKIRQETLCEYLRAIEGDYNHENPYHNEVHGADVLQTAHALLQMNTLVWTSTSPSPSTTNTTTLEQQHQQEQNEKEKEKEKEKEDEEGLEEVEELLHLSDLEKFSFLLAAIVHDVGHPGRNNSFQINRQTNLAMEYNDLSVLENMHASKAFRRIFQVKDVLASKHAAAATTTTTSTTMANDSLDGSSSNILPTFASASGDACMRDIVATDSRAAQQSIVQQVNRGSTFQEPYNILHNMETDDRTKLRKMIIEAVLHTDMSKHFVTVSKMKGLILSTLSQQQKAPQDTQGTTTNNKEDIASNSLVSFQQHISTQLKDGNPWEVLCFMLHLADISNPAKPQPMVTDWTDRCMKEFFAQGDDEAKLGLPISPNCDRATTQRADSQIGFIKFVILPAYEVLAEFLPAVGDEILPIIEANLLYWTETKAKEEQSPQKAAAVARAELQAIEKNRTIPAHSDDGKLTEEKTTKTNPTMKGVAGNFLSKFNRNKVPPTKGGEQGDQK